MTRTDFTERLRARTRPLLETGPSRWLLLAVVAALPVALACDGFGSGESMGPEAEGTFAVHLQAVDGGSSLRAGLTDYSGTASGEVDMDAVEAVNVTINGVEVHRTDSAGADGPWVSLDLTGGTNATSTDSVTVDLTGLSSDSALTVAVGDLEPGTYRNVRLHFSGAELVLSDTVTLGNASNGRGQGGETFPPGTYDLFIPGGQQTGIKVPTVGFTIGENGGESVTLFADAEASIRTINVTGRGFLMTPVLETDAGTTESDTTDTGDEVSSVDVSPDSASVVVGDTTRFSAVATNADGDTLPDADFAWSSTDTATATVDSAGLATGNATGTAAIVAESAGVADSARLEVTSGGG